MLTASRVSAKQDMGAGLGRCLEGGIGSRVSNSRYQT